MFAKSVLCLNTVKIFQLATGRTERLINGLITNIWERKSQAVIFSVLSSTETKHTFYIPTKVLCIVPHMAILVVKIVVKFQRKGYKINWFLAKNQCTQRKLLYFESRNSLNELSKTAYIWLSNFQCQKPSEFWIFLKIKSILL